MNSITISFLAYSLTVLGFGIYTARFTQNSSADFFLAGRSLGPWLTGLSAAASAESGWVTLGLVGMAFQTGVAAFWILPGTFAAFLFNWGIIANRMRCRAADSHAVTLPDMLADDLHGNRLLRGLAALITLCMLGAYIAAQLTAAAKAFEATFGWSYASGVAVGAGIVMLYTTLGGFRAVAWTDVLQAMLMIAAVTILPLVLLYQLGGFSGMWHVLGTMPSGESLTSAFAGKAGLALFGFLALWLGIPLGYSGQPHILVRFMAARDARSIRRAGMISTAWVCVLFSGAVLLGIAAHAYYGTLADPEKALPIAAADLLPGWLAGMMIAAVLAAVCSTADSQLLVCASCVSHDLLHGVLGRRASGRSLLHIHRTTVLGLGLIAMAIAMAEPRVIFHFVLYAWAGLGAAFGPVLILRLLWPRFTDSGAMAGMLTGFFTAIVWAETPVLKSMMYELPPAFLFAFVAAVLVSLATGKRSPGG